MGSWIQLDTAAGPVRAWLARPDKSPRGAVIVLQEIFGVNPHIRAVTDRYAEHGFVAMAPALFDPVQPDVELGYGDAGFTRGRELVSELGVDRALQVVSAAARWLRESNHHPGVVGFCWGGSMAFLANTRLGLPAVSYYGARTMPFIAETARALGTSEANVKAATGEGLAALRVALSPETSGLANLREESLR